MRDMVKDKKSHKNWIHEGLSPPTNANKTRKLLTNNPSMGSHSYNIMRTDISSSQEKIKTRKLKNTDTFESNVDLSG